MSRAKYIQVVTKSMWSGNKICGVVPNLQFPYIPLHFHTARYYSFSHIYNFTILIIMTILLHLYTLFRWFLILPLKLKICDKSIVVR